MLRISQSMMKEWENYKRFDNLCGLVFEAKYITKTYFSEPSDSQKEGIYFEYLCTGSLPKNGIMPQPERTLKGELTAPYKRAEQAANFFKQIIEHYGIVLKKVGYKLENDLMDGLLDIWAEWDGKEVIIDLKYSGLLDDKWNDLGWDLERLPQKHNTMRQAVHYKMLARDVLKKDVDFYFFVFNSKQPDDMKIILATIDEDKFWFHENDVSRIKSDIEKEITTGFKAKPDYRNCKECKLTDCKFRASYPLIQQVFYPEE